MVPPPVCGGGSCKLGFQRRILIEPPRQQRPIQRKRFTVGLVEKAVAVTPDFVRSQRRFIEAASRGSPSSRFRRSFLTVIGRTMTILDRHRATNSFPGADLWSARAVPFQLRPALRPWINHGSSITGCLSSWHPAGVRISLTHLMSWWWWVLSRLV